MSPTPYNKKNYRWGKSYGTNVTAQNRDDYKLEEKNICARLRARQYPKWTLDCAVHLADQRDRQELLQDKSKKETMSNTNLKILLNM